MEVKTYTYLDRTGWRRGEWDREPDKEQFPDPVTNLPCLIVRNRMGALCGYVGVGAAHPLHGLDYSGNDGIDVHGGLTFAGPCQHNPDEHGICHVPAPGEPDDAWWFGFDCAHFRDAVPGMSWNCEEDSYRDWSYVKAECAALALQLAKAADVMGVAP